MAVIKSSCNSIQFIRFITFNVVAAVIAMVVAVEGKMVTISNTQPRYNVSGEIMDAHDGTYNQWAPGGPWYYYAMGYGTCKQGGDMCNGHCGYGYSWIGVWKSPDMSNSSWQLVREARDSSWPSAVYFRVHVVYNNKTSKYVLWVNVDGAPECHARGPCYFVGTSTSPEGPFTFTNSARGALPGGGDFDILVDDDGSAYLIYTSTSHGHDMSIEKLSDDYLFSLAGHTPGPPPAPPAPLPSLKGFNVVGKGACRDSNNLEPPFYTNEGSKMQGQTDLQTCSAACLADPVCTGFSFCVTKNPGACHLYSTSQKGPAVNASEWTYRDGQKGDPSHITKVTDEVWWDCYTKSSEDGEETGLLKSSVSNERQLSHRVRVSQPSNVSSGIFGNTFVEAPAMFKRNGVYYALFGNCCCFCGHGSGIGVYTATKPLGPYTYHENIGCTVPLAPGCGCGMQTSSCHNYGKSLTKAQQNFVIRINSGGETQYVWTGDRWQSAADGIKAHDLQYWSVLQFSRPAGSMVDLPIHFTWQDNITINV